MIKGCGHSYWCGNSPGPRTFCASFVFLVSTSAHGDRPPTRSLDCIISWAEERERRKKEACCPQVSRPGLVPFQTGALRRQTHARVCPENLSSVLLSAREACGAFCRPLGSGRADTNFLSPRTTLA